MPTGWAVCSRQTDPGAVTGARLSLPEGFKEAAEKFRVESGIEPSVDLDTLDERIRIREMILKGQIQEAIALINSLHPELLDTNRYLHFHLQVRGGGGRAVGRAPCPSRAGGGGGFASVGLGAAAVRAARRASWRGSSRTAI